MILSIAIAEDYLETIDRIRYAQFSSHSELHWLEGQRALLHQQLVELLGHSPTVREVRTLVLEEHLAGCY